VCVFLPFSQREVNLRWMADVRSWGFAGVVAAVLANDALRAAMVSVPGAALVLSFLWFHRYPYRLYWVQNWWAASGDPVPSSENY
jgi:hypothetical protein